MVPDAGSSSGPRELQSRSQISGQLGGGVDVFVRDRKQETTSIVSRTAGGSESNGLSFSATISDDGRFVVFSSDATNLVADDTNGVSDVFVRGPL